MENLNGTEQQLRQTVRDEEHLNLLRIAYFVFGGTRAFFSLFGVMYMVMGVFFAFAIAAQPVKPGEAPPPEFVRWMFCIIGGGIFAIMVTLAVLDFVVAVRLGQRRSRTLCLVAAGLSCIFMPWGTLLGVFTFIVLCRSSVVRLFAAGSPGGVRPVAAVPKPPVVAATGAPPAVGSTPPAIKSSEVKADEGDATGGIIPYKNPPALVAYYLGIFSLIPCLGLILGIVAVILGVVGLKKRRQHPLVRGQVHAWIGIVLGTLVIVTHVLVVIGLATHAFG